MVYDDDLDGLLTTVKRFSDDIEHNKTDSYLGTNKANSINPTMNKEK